MTLVLAIIFWISYQKHRQKKKKVNKSDYIKQTKNLCIAKETINEMKIQPVE